MAELVFGQVDAEIRTLQWGRLDLSSGVLTVGDSCATVTDHPSAGHVSQQMLKHYSHTGMEAKRRAVQALVTKRSR